MTVCTLGLLVAGSRPALAAERSKIEIMIDDVTFRMTQECTGVDPRTGLMHVITRFELTPAPYAQTWTAYFTAEALTDDRAHALAGVAGIAMFFGQSPAQILDAMRKAGGDPQFKLDVIRLNVWQDPGVDVNQLTNAVRSALQLFSNSESGGVLREFDSLGAAVGLPGEQCDVIGKIGDE